MFPLDDGDAPEERAEVTFITHVEQTHEINPERVRIARNAQWRQLLDAIGHDLKLSLAVTAAIFATERF